MRLQYMSLLFACLMCLPLSAQKKKHTKEEFRAKKQAYMTEKAELTEEEAKNFFPLYFELQNKKKETNKATWKKAGKAMETETTEKEYEEIIDSFLSSQYKTLDLEKEYIKRYRKVLSDKKIYQIYWAEINFNRNMLKILQDMENK